MPGLALSAAALYDFGSSAAGVGSGLIEKYGCFSASVATQKSAISGFKTNLWIAGSDQT